MNGVDLATVFGAGLLTFGSPCVLPLIPIYLGMLLGSSLDAAKESGGRFRLLASTSTFALGFTLVFVLLGLGASTIGEFLRDHRPTMLWVGGALVVLFGLKYLGIIRLPWLDREKRFGGLRTGNRLLDAGIFGVVFALGWTPCVGPLLGTVLTFAASKASSPWMGALYLGTYSAGIALPLIGVGLASDRLLPLLRRVHKHLPKLEKATGVLLIIVGVWLISSSGAVPGLDSDVPPGPGVTAEGQAIEPYLGEPSETLRMVEFFTQSCPSCKRMAPRIEGLKRECVGKRIDVLQVDLGVRENQQLARRYRVSRVPTIALLAPDGREVRRFLGELSEDALREAAASLIEESCAGVEARPLSELSEEDGPRSACGQAQAELPHSEPRSSERAPSPPPEPLEGECGG